MINDAKKKGASAEDDWIHFADSGDPLPTNYGTTVTMDLRPGPTWRLLADRQAGRWHGPPARYDRHDPAVHRLLTRVMMSHRMTPEDKG